MNSSTGERKFGGGTIETHPRRQKRQKEKNRYKASRKDRYRRVEETSQRVREENR
jgi:hypothetical protein